VRLVNPVMRRLLASPLHSVASGQLLLLHFTGRRYTVPTGYHDLDGVPSVLTNSGWRVNFRGGAGYRGDPPRPAATGAGDPGRGPAHGGGGQPGGDRPGRLAGGPASPGHPHQRRPSPTQDQLTDAIRDAGLSIVRLDLR
jgi:hypothetical protein